MSLLPIVLWPDPGLHQRCRLVGPGEDVAALAADMLETMYHAPGRGLAAPQVGALLRLFVMDSGWKAGTATPMVFVNPEILDFSTDRATRSEGCLSIPGIAAEVTRPASVTLRWQGLDGTVQYQGFTGFEATCIQHEIDHLDGVLTLDRIDPAARALLLADRVA